MDRPSTVNDIAARIPLDEFPILQRGLYANHAAIAPWPRATSRAVVEFADENTRMGAEKYSHWLVLEKQLRARLARLINAISPNDIALLKNTTDGICTVANGIEWRKGDNVVIPADEFPSNRLPWLALERLGVEIREVDIRSHPQPEQAMLSRMDKHTRLLSVSAVQWTDGLRLNLETLGNACRSKNIFFFVDAIQQLGAVQLDVEACGIDFLAADGHKWLLAPEGIAVFYCRESVREQLQLQQRGWRMVDEPYRFDRDQWRASKAATRFEAGSPNTLGQVALHASVGLIQHVGMQYVEACICENSRNLSAGLEEMAGVELNRPFDLERASGIVSFRVPDLNPVALNTALKKQLLTCAVRGDSIRLSPHFYQFGEPVQDILTVVSDILCNMKD
jgi:selenocysteine lyase/cysteine desulfurase